MAGFGTLKTYEKSDENMMYWMGKGGVSKSYILSTSLYRTRTGIVRASDSCSGR
jgi:hypothetical protein